MARYYPVSEGLLMSVHFFFSVLFLDNFDRYIFKSTGFFFFFLFSF